jgi:hypothetical protein
MRHGITLLTKSGLVAGLAAVGLVAMLAIPHQAAAAGSWAVVTSPNQGFAGENHLLADSCPDISHCWAVGYFVDTHNQTLAEHWNGTSWTIVLPANQLNVAAEEANELTGISCVTDTDCWAVGQYQDTSATGLPFEPLYEHWDGASWTIPTTALPGVTSNSYWLNGVSCVDTSDCWAVGYRTTSPPTSTLAFTARWNGSSWSTASPAGALSGFAGTLNSVSCIDLTDCWAVGFTPSSSGGGADVTFILQWNGDGWILDTSPNDTTGGPVGDLLNRLNGVWCTSTSNCWAVGVFNDDSANQNLFEQWNGTSWSEVVATAANNSTGGENNNQLNAVTCTGAGNCWAVGHFFPPQGGFKQTLIDQWDGTSWTLVSSPNQTADATSSGPPADNDLLGVSCGDAFFCVSVGDYMILDPTLILQFTAPRPTPTPTPTPTASTAAVVVPVPATGASASAGSTLAPLIIGGGLLAGGVSIASLRGRRRLRR